RRTGSTGVRMQAPSCSHFCTGALIGPGRQQAVQRPRTCRLALLPAVLVAEAGADGWRDQAAKAFEVMDAELDDLLDVGAAGHGELVAGHEEDGLDAADHEVHVGLLELVVQV